MEQQEDGNNEQENPNIGTVEEAEVAVLTAAAAKGNIDMDNEIELTYKPMKMDANSTAAGNVSGLKSMDVFCQLQRIKKMSEYKTSDFDDPKVCDKVITNFKCFCTFILVAQSNRGKHYKPGSQGQMLSNVFNYLHKTHPGVKMFDTNKYPVESGWYTDLLRALKKNGFGNAIKRGESVGDKAVGIRRKLLEGLTHTFTTNRIFHATFAVVGAGFIIVTAPIRLLLLCVLLVKNHAAAT